MLDGFAPNEAHFPANGDGVVISPGSYAQVEASAWHLTPNYRCGLMQPELLDRTVRCLPRFP